MPKNYRELTDSDLLWSSVTNLEIDPDYSQNLYSNGYNMVRIDVWFTPTCSNESGNAPTPVSVPQDVLNSATRLIDYDTGTEIPFLTTPPTPDHPISSTEFQNFKSWAQTQTANDFLTPGNEASSRQIDDSSQSCVTFYILCNRVNPNPNPLTLGVQIKPTNGDLLKYCNGSPGLGSNGAKEISAQPFPNYGIDSFVIKGINVRHDDGGDDTDINIGGAEPIGNLWRQYNFTVAFSDNSPLQSRSSANSAVRTSPDGTPTTALPVLSKAIGGYTTCIFNWPDDAPADISYTYSPELITDSIDPSKPFTPPMSMKIPDNKSNQGETGWCNSVRVTATFATAAALGNCTNIQPITLTIWDSFGNYGTFHLNGDLKTYIEVDSSYDPQKEPWLPLTSDIPTADSSISENNVIVNGQYGTLARDNSSNNYLLTYNSIDQDKIDKNLYNFFISQYDIKDPYNRVSIFNLYYQNPLYMTCPSDGSEDVLVYQAPEFNCQQSSMEDIEIYLHPSWKKNGFYFIFSSNNLIVSGVSSNNDHVQAVNSINFNDSASNLVWYYLSTPKSSFSGWGPAPSSDE